METYQVLLVICWVLGLLAGLVKGISETRVGGIERVTSMFDEGDDPDVGVIDGDVGDAGASGFDIF